MPTLAAAYREPGSEQTPAAFEETQMPHPRRPESDVAPRPRLGRRALGAALLMIAAAVPLLAAAPAQAAACSTSSSTSTCTMSTTTTVTNGALGVAATPSLNWAFVQSGYDQVESGSSGALSSCTAAGSATTCSGGVAPLLQVVDARGGSSGWALSAYVSGSTLPSGTTLTFNGGGTTIGASRSGSGVTVTAAAPTTVCDSGSSCTPPTAASTCSHSGDLGFTACPTYGVAVPVTGGDGTHQVDLYSAAASTGLGAICFGSSAPTGSGCAGTTSTAFFNMRMPAGAATGTYTGAVVNLTATSGP